MRRASNSVAVLAMSCALLLSFTPLAASAQTATSSLLVKLAAGLSPAQQVTVIQRNGGIEISSIPPRRLHVIRVATADLAQVLANYQADPDVVSAEENRTHQSQASPADPRYQNQWSLSKIGWDLVFGTVTATDSVVVAVLDTGVDPRHPDLAGNVIAGTSILDGSSGTTDPSGHGTWIAGIVAARTNTPPLEGVAGGPSAGVRVMPVTVLDANGRGQDSDIVAGVIWAADHGADVIVMAFSNPGFSQNLQDAIDYAWSKNVILVAATGNDGLDTPTFPAGHRGVMGVSGTDPSDTLAPFSNHGGSVFIAAPATDIRTTEIGDTYTVISGTSASAAIVARAAAFMKAVDPSLTNGVIVGRLACMADPAGTPDQTGNGRINMARALADTGTDFVQPPGARPVGQRRAVRGALCGGGQAYSVP
jgi:subtilisin family serine protease